MVKPQRGTAELVHKSSKQTTRKEQVDSAPIFYRTNGAQASSQLQLKERRRRQATVSSELQRAKQSSEPQVASSAAAWQAATGLQGGEDRLTCGLVGMQRNAPGMRLSLGLSAA